LAATAAAIISCALLRSVMRYTYREIDNSSKKIAIF
jgi:hypothetical protein